jgi:uncharacterized delta-60 repeat protein
MTIRNPTILGLVLLWAAVPAAGTVIEAWSARYDGPVHAMDEARDIAVDGEGCVYVVGRSEGYGQDGDALTIKYGADGHELWVARYDGPHGDRDSAHALAFCPDGDIVVTGGSFDTLTDSNYLTIRYDPDGFEEWVAVYDGPGSGEDYAYDVVCDSEGSIYITGSSWGGVSAEDVATVKYDPDGTRLWVSRYEGPVRGLDSGHRLALGRDESVYLVGRSMGGQTSYDILTIKYDSDGNEQWAARYDGDVSFDDRGLCIAVDGRGRIYVAGVCWGGYPPGTQWDYATIQYDEDGAEGWVAIYDGPGRGYDLPYGIGIDSMGSVYVTGDSAESGTDITDFDYDYATIKYDSLGNELWVRRHEGGSDGHDGASDLAIDGEDNLYVTGSAAGDDTHYRDYCTIKYSPDGDTLWTATYNGPSGESDYANAIVLDEAANVYVTGGSSNAWDDRDFATVKYVQETASLEPRVSLSMTNPCRGDVTFRVHAPTAIARATLEVFDLSGRLVATPFVGSLTPPREIHWSGLGDGGLPVASGVYFVRLRADGEAVHGRLVVVR